MSDPTRELPKSIEWYLEATKWIVSLATGSLILSGNWVTDTSAQSPAHKLAVAIATLAMTLCVLAGARALICFTRWANLAETRMRNPPAAPAPSPLPNPPPPPAPTGSLLQRRWERAVDWLIPDTENGWLRQGAGAYTTLTFLFVGGIFAFMASTFYAMGTDKSEPRWILTPAPDAVSTSNTNPALGMVHDATTGMSCVLLEHNGVLSCVAPTMSSATVTPPAVTATPNTPANTPTPQPTSTP